MTGRERREQLLDVGRALFAEKGFDATSIEEIAARAEVSKPVVYEHFGGKEGLYAVVVDREMSDLLDRLTHRADARAPARLVEQAALALLTYIEEETDGFRILSRDSRWPVRTGTFSVLLNDIASQVEHIMVPRVQPRGLRHEARADVRADAGRHGRADRPVVARGAQADARGGRRASGQPRLERARPPGPEAADDHRGLTASHPQAAGAVCVPAPGR